MASKKKTSRKKGKGKHHQSAATKEIHRLHAQWLRVQIREAKKKARNKKSGDQEHRHAIERLRKLTSELHRMHNG